MYVIYRDGRAFFQVEAMLRAAGIPEDAAGDLVREYGTSGRLSEDFVPGSSKIRAWFMDEDGFVYQIALMRVEARKGRGTDEQRKAAEDRTRALEGCLVACVEWLGSRDREDLAGGCPEEPAGGGTGPEASLDALTEYALFEEDDVPGHVCVEWDAGSDDLPESGDPDGSTADPGNEEPDLCPVTISGMYADIEEQERKNEAEMSDRYFGKWAEIVDRTRNGADMLKEVRALLDGTFVMIARSLTVADLASQGLKLDVSGMSPEEAGAMSGKSLFDLISDMHPLES